MAMWLGSPPHTWRILKYCFQVIPSGRDHLHIRGEYPGLIIKNNVFVGSPPHTWRIPLLYPTDSIFAGITSTYVENTSIHLIYLTKYKDHLHIRGEYSIV